MCACPFVNFFLLKFTRGILIYNLETFTFPLTVKLHATKMQELYTKKLSID